LTNAINDAITQGIVIICSTADDGNNKTPSAISQHPDTIAIAACDDGGKSLDFTVEEGYQYLVPGKDIIAGAVPFVESQESISGSSAATAIAAGLASLTLSCLHLANNERVKEEKKTKWAKEEIQSRFDRMARVDHNGSGVYVKPWLFCGQEPDKTYTVDKAVDIPSVETLIQGCFNGKSMWEMQ
jgi:subtilisin family serine protease